ncbi:MAG: PAS domain S-box protein [Desulfomonilaceae bacterium]|nr:PAS domain S-box protein [Desulfomonilaceae bacterium]
MEYPEIAAYVIDEIQELRRENRTLRKTVEEYRSMVDKYRTLAECSLAGIYVVQDGRFQYVNPRFLKIMGYEREEDLIGRTFQEVVHEEDRPVGDHEGLWREKDPAYPDLHTFRAIRQDGSVAWLNLSNVAARYMERPADIGTVVDISEQKESQEALLQSEEKYRTIIEQIEDGYYEVDLDGNFTFFNDSFARILGYPTEEIMGVNYADFAVPGEERNIGETFRGVYSSGDPALAIAWEVFRRDGARRHIELSVSLIRDRLGRRIGFRGIVRDITERKRVEEELTRHRNHLEDLVRERSAELVAANESLSREVAERTRAEEELIREKRFSDSVIDSQPGLFYLIDRSGRFHRWNANLEELGGYSHEQMTRKEALEFFVPEDRSLVEERINEVFVKGRASVEAMLITRNGTPIPHLMTGVRIELDGEVYLVGVGMDITERKQAEEALTASERELRILSGKLISAQENERQRLAMELHDGIGQALTAIKVRVEGVLRKTQGLLTEEAFTPLLELIPTIQHSVEEVRRMSRDLRPAMLDTLGILSTIGWLCRQFKSLYPHIAVVKEIDVEEEDVPENLKIVIFRILQEASNNVVKHSGADRLLIRVGPGIGGIELVIKDNGTGFDLGSALRVESDQRGFGLASMKERTKLSGGKYFLRTGPGIGTTIKAVWPSRRVGSTG